MNQRSEIQIIADLEIKQNGIKTRLKLENTLFFSLFCEKINQNK